MGEQIKTACRIPCEYVVVSGAGQSNKGAGIDPWETVDYDMALLEAGIENFNVVKYTSVLPPESKEITMDEARERGLLHHGAELMCIMAQVNGEQNQHICAGVGRAQVFKKQAGGPDLHIGGFAAEYEGYGSKEKGAECLRRSLEGIFKRRYRKSDDYYMPKDQVQITVKDLCVDDKFGTVLVAVAFLTYLEPTS